jgi:hypothetical protein
MSAQRSPGTTTPSLRCTAVCARQLVCRGTCGKPRARVRVRSFQEREPRDGAAKWHEFNDRIVREFSEDRLREECFGGSYVIKVGGRVTSVPSEWESDRYCVWSSCVYRVCVVCVRVVVCCVCIVCACTAAVGRGSRHHD